jgi:hypothetical protein
MALVDNFHGFGFLGGTALAILDALGFPEHPFPTRILSSRLKCRAGNHKIRLLGLGSYEQNIRSRQR